MDALKINDRESIELVAVPPGEFSMGSGHGLPLERPVHAVHINPLLIARFPITQSQWMALMGCNPSAFSGEKTLPVDTVSWDDAKTFCARLSASTGSHVRLPAEAEWEYACRAGTTNEFFFGDDEAALIEFAWFDLNSNGRTQPVGLKKPNNWGLYDMAGNVWEWCEDVWHSDYENAPTDGTAWLDNGDEQPRRCLRGGAWNYDAFRGRSAYRSREWKHYATDSFGFRVVVTPLP